MRPLKIRCLLLTLSILISSSSFALQPKQPATDLYKEKVARFYGLKSTKNLILLKLKNYQQVEAYTCGPAAVMSVLHYYGKLTDAQMNKATEMKIANEMGTSPDTGTNPKQITTWLQHHGFNVISGENGTLDLLRSNLEKNIPTIVEWVDWGGHWVVTAGYDKGGKNPTEDKDTIFFEDPSAHFDNVKYINGITTINPDRFASMWFDAQYFNPGHLVKGIYIIATPNSK